MVTSLHCDEFAPGLDVQPLGHPILAVQAVRNSRIAACLLGVRRRRVLSSRCRLFGEHLCPLDGISIQQEPGINVPACLLLLGLRNTNSLVCMVKSGCSPHPLPCSQKHGVQRLAHAVTAFAAPNTLQCDTGRDTTIAMLLPPRYKKGRAYHQGIIQPVIRKEKDVNELSILYMGILSPP